MISDDKVSRDAKGQPTKREIGVLQTMSQKGLPHALAVRLFFGMEEIKRHVLHKKEEQEAFDKLYEPFAESIWDAGYCKDTIKEILDEHVRKVESGEVAKIINDGGQLNIEEHIDVGLRVAFKGIFLHGRIALSFLGKMGKQLGYDINFIYQNDKDFEKGLQKFLEKNDTPIMKFVADRIRAERAGWYSFFIKKRIEIEHEGWKLPQIKYTVKKGIPSAVVPTFSGDLGLVAGSDSLFIRLFEFCEDMIALMLGSRLPAFMALVHLPEKDRKPELPNRYIVVPNFEPPGEAAPPTEAAS